MPYISLEKLRGEIPEEYLTEALDDDGDGIIDAWTDVEAKAAGKVDAYLSTRYAVPVPHPIPPIVTEATAIFACELCYTRRGRDENPFTEAAVEQRRLLTKIASGHMPLQLETTGPTPGAVVTHPSTLGAPGRRLM